MKPVYLEVVTNMLTAYTACNSCRLVFSEGGVDEMATQAAIDEYPAEMKEEFLRLTEWLAELARLYRHRIAIRFVDAKSLAGIYKSLRHRFRTYPAFIVDRKDVVAGWDREKLARLLEEHMERARRSRTQSP